MNTLQRIATYTNPDGSISSVSLLVSPEWVTFEDNFGDTVSFPTPVFRQLVDSMGFGRVEALEYLGELIDERSSL